MLELYQDSIPHLFSFWNWNQWDVPPTPFQVLPKEKFIGIDFECTFACSLEDRLISWFDGSGYSGTDLNPTLFKAYLQSHYYYSCRHPLLSHWEFFQKF